MYIFVLVGTVLFSVRNEIINSVTGWYYSYNWWLLFLAESFYAQKYPDRQHPDKGAQLWKTWKIKFTNQSTKMLESVASIIAQELNFER